MELQLMNKVWRDDLVKLMNKRKGLRNYDYERVSKFLVEHSGTGVNGKDQNNWALLHVSAERNDLKAMKLLLEHGNADVNVTGKHNWTPLHLSSWKGHLEVVKFLIEQGKADVIAN
ncbi:hypothetical protein H0H87_004632, partial [Tephrocybe sp. NHM501043]